MKSEPTGPPIDVAAVRNDFPILDVRVHGRPLVYLDSAATSHKPRAVLDAVDCFYRRRNSNVHRGVHALSEEATRAYEGARARVARFLNASRPEEIVFVRGATEAVNLVARAFVSPRLGPGDEVLVSALEHHSNIVPWQLVCEAAGAHLRVLPVDEAGNLVLDGERGLDGLLADRTRILAVTHVSNAIGTVNPVVEIVRRARARGVPVLVDGAQAVPHLRVDVRSIDADFYVFSGHKVYGPTGIGVLWARGERLASMPPWQGGGEMIREVSFEGTTFADPPWRFEAGTPDISGAVGLAAALDYVEDLGLDLVRAHETALVERALRALADVPGLRVVGAPRERAGLVSFLLGDLPPHDVGILLDREGVAVRAGHHCAQPLLRRLGLAATVRASFAVYNTAEEVDRLAQALRAIAG